MGEAESGAMTDLIAQVGVPELARDAIAKWLELVKTWNARIDLTAAKTNRDLVDLMVADALVLAANIEHGLRVVDVGSGAGAPGLALALLRPDLKLTLIEPLTKRVSFLRTVIGTVGRTDIAVVKGKGEDVAARFDIAISRATLNPPAWVPLGLRLAPSVWTLLAREEPPTIDGATVDRDISYTWPLAGQSGASRRAVRHVLQHATSV
jgi:16S rRNA (guanine527-N7)-methyltransferase